MSHTVPTQSQLREQLFYDFKEGLLIPKTRPGRNLRKAPGKVSLRIGGHQYHMHRLVWAYFNGDIPEGWMVTHVDNDKTNNHVQNLKLKPHSEISHAATRNNRTGYRGVFRCDPKADRYKAVIRRAGRSYHLGCFDSPMAAAYAYNKRAVELYGAGAVLNEGV